LNTYRTLHPSSTFFPSALQTQFNTTCFQFTSQSHLLANKRFRDRAASYIGAGGSQRLLRALPGAIIFGEPSPQARLASWATSAARTPLHLAAPRNLNTRYFRIPINIRRRHRLSPTVLCNFLDKHPHSFGRSRVCWTSNAACTIYRYQQLQRVRASETCDLNTFYC
jgi:hypothetical protein